MNPPVPMSMREVQLPDTPGPYTWVQPIEVDVLGLRVTVTVLGADADEAWTRVRETITAALRGRGMRVEDME